MNAVKSFMRSEGRDYAFITLGLLVYTFGWTLFLLPYEIVTGGVTGFSAIIYYATGFKIENSYLIINVALLAVALKVLGVKFMMKTIYAISALYLMLKVAQMIMPCDDAGNYVKVLGEGQNFMSLVIGCSFTGLSLAIVFSNNGSTGGTDIVAAVVNKYYSLSLGQVLIIVDFLIIGSCFFFPQFGTMMEKSHKVVFGLCSMLIENVMLDYIMNRNRESVQFLVFSRKYEEIAHLVATEMDHGVTVLDGHGWYTGDEVKVLCILARRNESQQILRIIKHTDPKAFVSQSSVSGVYGEGFDQIKVRVKGKGVKNKLKGEKE